MRGIKAKLKKTAPIGLIGVQGYASVHTVQNVVAGVVFLKHDFTGEEFMADEEHVEFLSAEDAAVQGLIFQAHIDEIRARRNRKTKQKGR